MRRHVTEEFTFQQVWRECTAVECNERLIAPAACIVDALCKNFISGACLTHQKNIGIILCEKVRVFLYLTDGGRFTDQILEGIFCLMSFDIGFSSQLLFHLFQMRKCSEMKNDGGYCFILFNRCNVENTVCLCVEQEMVIIRSSIGKGIFQNIRHFRGKQRLYPAAGERLLLRMECLEESGGVGVIRSNNPF